MSLSCAKSHQPRVGYPLIKLIGIEGNKCDIVPRTDTDNKDRYLKATEIWNKKGEPLGLICFDYRKRWNKFVLFDLDKEMQMSKDCLDEAFEMTQKYWEEDDKPQPQKECKPK